MPVAAAQVAQWIPLRDDYFETPLLSSKETAYLVRKSCEAAQEVVERARSSGGPIQWRHVEKYNDVQLYAGFSRGTYSAEPTSMCGVTSVPGTIKEIALLFDMGSTRAMKEFSKDHRDLFFDAVVLYTLSPRTKEKPLHQVTAKWIATQCPKGMDDRDYCYLECQDKFVDSSGRKGWVMCLHSIKLPGCEELTREFGFVRGSFYHSGIVVVEADRPGYVDVIHMLQINLKNNTKMPQAYLRERVAWIARLKRILRHKRLNEQRYLSDLELVPKKYRSRCNVCQDSFSLLLLRKMNCRKCGEVVCGACSKEFDVTNAKFLETIKLRICMHCYQMITLGQSQTNVLDPPHASTVGLLGYHEDNQRASIITEVPDLNSHDGNPQGIGRETRTKIYLQTMRERQSERRSHRVRGTEPGYRMGPVPPPMSTVDPLHRTRTSTRAVPQPRSTGVYDSRSLFDGPRGGRGNGYGEEVSEPVDTYQFPPPPSSMTPAWLFDRQSSRSRAGEYEMRRRDDRQTISMVSPSSSTRSKQRHISTRDSRGAFKIPHSLYDYSSLDPTTANVPPPMSPRQHGHRESSGSTGSIDIDAYQAAAAQAAVAAGVTQLATPERVVPKSHRDYDSDEGSIGSGDEDDTPKRDARPANGSRRPMYFDDDEVEETKSEEYELTPALPPPSPSAYHTTHDALQSSVRSMDLPFTRNLLISNASSMDGDTSYLDTEMRQFHGQPFYMRGASRSVSDERQTFDMAHVESPASPHDNRICIQADGASPSGANGLFLSSKDVSATNAVPPAVTSPEKPAGMEDRPPLYGYPRKSEPENGGDNQRRSSPSLRLSQRSENRASEQSTGSHLLQSFDVHASMMSNSTFQQDLAFEAGPSPMPRGSTNGSAQKAAHVDEEAVAVGIVVASAIAVDFSPPVDRAPPPPPPAYVPSRFQNRPSQSNQLDINDLVSEPPKPKQKQPAERRPATLKEIQAAMARNSFGSDNQDESEDEESDVDFEELLRLPVPNPGDDRLRGLSQVSDISHGSSDLGEVQEESEDSDLENQDLLSARRMFKKFGSTKRLSAIVQGVDQNPTFQRTFDQIQESIDMLSDSDDDEGVEWTEHAGSHQVRL